MDFWWSKKRTWQAWLLLPFSWCYHFIIFLRQLAYRWALFQVYQPPVPLIVVGNLTVGGTGKTPLVIALVTYLQQQGWKVGVVSRGYGGKAPHYPFHVLPTSNPHHSGDEPLLIVKRTKCEVFVDPNRVRAIQALLAHSACDVIISDDGLQHLAMKHDIAIAVVDGIRRFGNGLLLPAGPLRESYREHMASYLWVVTGGHPEANEWPMQLVPHDAYHIQSGEIKAVKDFALQKVIALAGLGHPARFFNMLRDQGLYLVEQAFPDHHHYILSDFARMDKRLPWLITEKDAMKCQDLVSDNTWVVPVSADLPPDFWMVLNQRLDKYRKKT